MDALKVNKDVPQNVCFLPGETGIQEKDIQGQNKEVGKTLTTCKGLTLGT